MKLVRVIHASLVPYETLAGNSIMVVYPVWDRVAWVRFPVSRHVYE